MNHLDKFLAEAERVEKASDAPFKPCPEKMYLFSRNSEVAAEIRNRYFAGSGRAWPEKSAANHDYLIYAANSLPLLVQMVRAAQELCVNITPKRPFDDAEGGTANDGWEIAAQFARNFQARLESLASKEQEKNR